MIDCLYTPFKHWSEKGGVFIISDPHFDDEDMKIFFPDKISSEEIVKRINSKVGKNDTLIMLGDIGNIEWVKRLKGYKVLITGNHDDGNSNYQRKVEIRIYDKALFKKEEAKENMSTLFPNHKIIVNEGYNLTHSPFDYWECKADNQLFDEIYNGPLFISDKLLLSHEPLDIDYALNIHGHIHDLSYNGDKYHLNTTIEAVNYTPINLKQLIKNGRLSDIDSIHRITIDNATNKKREKIKK